MLMERKLRQSAQSSLGPLVMLLGAGLLVSVATVHAESVPLSTLIANPSAEISGPGGFSFSHFTSSSSLMVSDISVTTDSVSSTQSRIRLGLFTAPAFATRGGIITYQVMTTSPITDFHVVTPTAVRGGQQDAFRAFEEAGYVLTTDVRGIGTSLISRVGLGSGLGPADSGLHTTQSLPLAQPPPTFPSNAATLAVVNDLLISGGGGPNNSLTLPYFDNVYTVSVVPEPSTWLLLTSGLIALLRRRANSSP